MQDIRIPASVTKTWAVWIAVALSLSGCRGVASPQPFGEKPHEIVLEEWDGAWLDSQDGVLLLMVADAKEGLLLMVGVERQEGRPVMESNRPYLRESEGWLFASILEEKTDEADPERYQWARVKNDGDTLLVWLPEAERFERLVREGALPGRIESGDVVLGELDPSHYALIRSDERGTLFDWDDPIVFRRIAGRRSDATSRK